MTKPRGGRGYEIRDADTVTRIIDWILEQRAEAGSWDDLGWRFAGVHQATLARFARQEPRAMSEATYESLSEYLRSADRGDLAEELRTAVLGTVAQHLLARYFWWRQECAQRYAEESAAMYLFVMRGQLSADVPDDIRSWTFGEIDEDDASPEESSVPSYPFVIGTLRSVAAVRMRELEELHIYLRGTDWGEAALRRLQRAFDVRKDDWLLHPALLRVLEPLLSAPISGFVERHWRELSETELRQFVEAGVRREEILARRDSDWQRAQHVAEHGPHYLSGASAPAASRAAADKPARRKRSRRT